LVDAARAVGPVVREHVEFGERERTLSPVVASHFREAGFFRLCRPREYGGVEADPVTMIRVLEEIARADGAAGWCAMISGAGAVLDAFLPLQGAREMFAESGTVSGLVFAPSGRAVAAPGGYRVSGRWQMASNCHQCQWLGGGCLVFDGERQRIGSDGTPEMLIATFASADLTIVDTWSSLGLRGTGSHDFEVSDVFVPARRVVRLPFASPTSAGALYAYPVFGLLASAVAATAIGIGRAAVDEVVRLAGAKVPFGMRSSLATRPSAQHAVAEAEGALTAGRSALLECTADVWSTVVARQPVSVTQRARLRIAATHATWSAVRAADLAYGVGGASSIYAKSPLQRCFRDVHTLTQHVLVASQTNEMTGRILLGAVDDLPML
jgi:alkylation response protein AidB-like acyl-CoA dehydrogenase